MKAIHKPTGKIVDVEYDINSQSARGEIYRDKNGNAFCKPDLDFNYSAPNWEQVRIQAAIAVMQGMYSHNSMLIVTDFQYRAEMAIRQANALIDELKKKK